MRSGDSWGEDGREDEQRWHHWERRGRRSAYSHHRRGMTARFEVGCMLAGGEGRVGHAPHRIDIASLQ